MSDDIINMLRDSADDFLSAQVNLDQQKGRIGIPTLRNREDWSAIAELGWLGLALPETLGGMAMGIDAAAALCEVFGRRLFAEPYITGVLMPSAVLAQSSVGAASELAEGLAAGSHYLTLAWQEHTGEADDLRYGTRWVDGKLNGRKRFVSALEDDGTLLVAAHSDRGTVIVAVAAEAAGVSLERVATAQGHYADVRFTDTPALFEPLLVGAEADAAIKRAVVWARVAAAAQLTGIARGCLNATTDYVSQRRQFDRTLGSFQSVAHRCADLLVGVEMADAVWAHAAAEASVAESPELLASVYAAKARAGDVALTTGRTAVQLHGAMGFTEECSIGLYLRAAMQYNSWLGAPAAMRRHFLTYSGQRDLLMEACNG